MGWAKPFRNQGCFEKGSGRVMEGRGTAQLEVSGGTGVDSHNAVT